MTEFEFQKLVAKVLLGFESGRRFECDNAGGSPRKECGCSSCEGYFALRKIEIVTNCEQGF